MAAVDPTRAGPKAHLRVLPSAGANREARGEVTGREAAIRETANAGPKLKPSTQQSGLRRCHPVDVRTFDWLTEQLASIEPITAQPYCMLIIAAVAVPKLTEWSGWGADLVSCATTDASADHSPERDPIRTRNIEGTSQVVRLWRSTRPVLVSVLAPRQGRDSTCCLPTG